MKYKDDDLEFLYHETNAYREFYEIIRQLISELSC